MSPPNPKRPPRSPPSPPGDTTAQPDDVELPFDDDEVAPLQADDPRPQRVPQFPMGPRRRPRRGGGGTGREERDRELPPARFTSGEYEDTGHARAYLYVERGPGVGQLVPIQQGVLRLGRASTSDLRLQHPSISRRHAQLTRLGDRLTLKDLGSQNGTYVNRARLATERELVSGDEIALGNALLRVRGPGPTPARPPIPYSRTPSSLRVRMSGPRLMLLASATGALAAVFLMLPLVRVMRSLQQAPRAVEQPEAEARRDEAPLVLEPTRPAPASPPTPRPAPRAPSEASPPRATASRPTRDGEPTAAARPALDPSDTARQPEEETEILAHYEAGRVDAALELAQREHREPLTTLLSRFQAEWSAGNAALAAQDPGTAIPHLTEALALDQRIAHGWGTLAPRLRKSLAQAQLKLRAP